jgi:hypothetical protein
MPSFAEKCVLAVLGYTALTNYQAHVADTYQIRQEQRFTRGDRTEGLILRWQEQRPNAELAAQFYRLDETRSGNRRGRRRANPQQIQFFEDQLFATVNFWRVAGADIALGRANAGELSSYMASDARTWLALLRQQSGRWDEARNLQILQAVRGLELIANENVGVRPADWEALEIGGFEITRQDSDIIDVAVEVFNPNDADSPVAPLFIVPLLIGSALLLWPSQPKIPARGRTTFILQLSARYKNADFEIRFAAAHEI